MNDLGLVNAFVGATVYNPTSGGTTAVEQVVGLGVRPRRLHRRRHPARPHR
ncbi:MAG: hypothetical protein R2699_09105 [Acidimicrobiales bacterium]